MVICSAYGCSNRTDRKQRKPGVSFHKFPKEKVLREQWVKAVHRLNWKPGVNSFLCSEHFSAEFLNRTFASGRTELRENAVPTRFSNYPPHLQPPIKKIRKLPGSYAAKPPSTSAVPKPPSLPEHKECSSEELKEISEPSSNDFAVQMPGSICSVAMCKSNAIISKKLGDNVRFFTFPKDAKLRREWVERCLLPENFNWTNKRVCSKHFKADDFEDAIEAKIQNRLPKVLKRDCVPSLNLQPEKTSNLNISASKTTRLDRAAKRKQKDFIKRILEAEKQQDLDSENQTDSSDNKQNDKNESGMEDKDQNDDAAKAREMEMERRISEFISSKVQILFAELI